MKVLAFFSMLATAALAQDSIQIDLAQIANDAGNPNQKRGVSLSELENGECRQITFIYARGSTEPGNMGLAPGPQTCSGLKDQYGSSNVACQGVGGPYSGDLFANLLPRGTNDKSIDEGIRLLNLAKSKCPSTKIVAGGYSQGAALMAAAISSVSLDVQIQINSAVLYGYTRNQQNNGLIPGFPGEKTEVICEDGDLVCTGTLVVTVAHLLYLRDVGTAVDFFVGSINDH